MRKEMNARQWANPDNLFDVFANLTYSPTDSKDVLIDSVVPVDYDAHDILNQIPKFAYPCKYDSPGVEYYTFVLTDVEAKFHYGFCRFSHDQHHIICLISRLPWFDVFYLLLNKISELSTSPNGESDVRRLLEAVYSSKVPAPNEPCVVLDKSPLMFTFDGPDMERLPSIPENRNLTEYYSALDYDMMINVFACMLNERRILVTSKKLGKLTACCHAAASLLYPCYWQHLFIPVLPEAVLEFVLAPMPYIIGVQGSLMEKVKSMDLEDAVILNIDDGTMTSPHDDRTLLPTDSVSTLRKALKLTAQDDSVARAFLRCLVRVIGGYRDGLQYQDEIISFDADVYIASTSSSGEKVWREAVIKMQYFSQFIEERLVLLNSGKGFQGEFEAEMTRYYDDKNNGAQYKEWLSSMRKHGKKFKTKGQHTFFHLGKKMQDTSKKAYRDVRNRLDERLKRDKDYSIIDKGNSHYGVKEGEKTNLTPRTIPSTPLRASRPPRPQTSQSPTEAAPVSSPKRQSYSQAITYTPLSFSDEDPPCLTSLMIDPDLIGFMSGKSFSTTNISLPSESNNNSTTISNTLRSSVSLSPIAPPRRRRTEQLLALSTEDVTPAGLENEGFSDNFTPMIDSVTSTSTSDHSARTSNHSVSSTISVDMRKANGPVSSMLDTTDSSSTGSNARSSLNDLIGLDLSPNNPVAPPVQAPVQASCTVWDQTQPNYFVSGTTQVNALASSTNPFNPPYNNTAAYNNAATAARSDFRMSASSSSPSLMSMTANGQVPTRKVVPARPPPPTLTPQPTDAQNQRVNDPLADLKW